MAQRKRDRDTQQVDLLSEETWPSDFTDTATAISDDEVASGTTASRATSRRALAGLTLLRVASDSPDTFVVETGFEDDVEGVTGEEEEGLREDDLESDDPFMFLSSGILGASVAGGGDD